MASQENPTSAATEAPADDGWTQAVSKTKKKHQKRAERAERGIPPQQQGDGQGWRSRSAGGGRDGGGWRTQRDGQRQGRSDRGGWRQGGGRGGDHQQGNRQHRPPHPSFTVAPASESIAEQEAQLVGLLQEAGWVGADRKVEFANCWLARSEETCNAAVAVVGTKAEVEALRDELQALRAQNVPTVEEEGEKVERADAFGVLRVGCGAEEQELDTQQVELPEGISRDAPERLPAPPTPTLAAMASSDSAGESSPRAGAAAVEEGNELGAFIAVATEKGAGIRMHFFSAPPAGEAPVPCVCANMPRELDGRLCLTLKPKAKYGAPPTDGGPVPWHAGRHLAELNWTGSRSEWASQMAEGADHALVTFRHWGERVEVTLPGGKREPMETPLHCALRELAKECGASVEQVSSRLEEVCRFMPRATAVEQGQGKLLVVMRPRSS